MLAKAVGQFAVMLDVPASSRASSLPQVILGVQEFCVHHRPIVGAGLLAIAVAQPHRCRHKPALALDLDLDAPLNHAGRTQALRSGHPGMDAGIAALGHGWPFAAAHGAMPE